MRGGFCVCDAVVLASEGWIDAFIDCCWLLTRLDWYVGVVVAMPQCC